jgi:hypothetical protein
MGLALEPVHQEGGSTFVTTKRSSRGCVLGSEALADSARLGVWAWDWDWACTCMGTCTGKIKLALSKSSFCELQIRGPKALYF